MTEAAPSTVLLVDDEHSIVEALGELLTWEGYLVRAAPNGRAALAALRDGPVDVVLLDLMMPGMDGLALAAAMKADGALRHIPIVLMSAAPIPRGGDEDWDAALQKPFDLDTLRSTLASVLSARRSAGGR